MDGSGRRSGAARVRSTSVVAAQELLALVSEDSGLLRALLRGMRCGRPGPARPGPPVPARRAALRRAGPPAPRADAAPRGEPAVREGDARSASHGSQQVARERDTRPRCGPFRGIGPCRASCPRGRRGVSRGEAGAPVLAQAGDTLGVVETLAEAPLGPARVTVAGRALRLEGDALVELLAEDTGLLQGIFSVLREVEAEA